MSAFHPATVEVLHYELAVHQRFKAAAEEAAYDADLARHTAVVADLAELLRLIAQANANAAEQDRQIREHDAAEALRIELHLTGPDENALADLAVRCSHPAVTA